MKRELGERTRNRLLRIYFILLASLGPLWMLMIYLEGNKVYGAGNWVLGFGIGNLPVDRLPPLGNDVFTFHMIASLFFGIIWLVVTSLVLLLKK